MTIEEIRKGAPLGATHYILRRNGDVAYYIKHMNIEYINGRWSMCEFIIDNVRKIKPLY